MHCNINIHHEFSVGALNISSSVKEYTSFPKQCVLALYWQYIIP